MESRLKEMLTGFFPAHVDSPLMTFSMNDLPGSDFWNQIEESLIARELSSRIYQKFDVSWGEEFFVKKGLALHVESGSPYLRPHTDSASDVERSPAGDLRPCAFSMQIYLPVDLRDESLGTRIYEEDPQGEFIERRCLPYRRNFALAFRPDSVSYHGFPVLNLGPRFRTSLVMRHNLHPREKLESFKNRMPSKIQERPG